MRYLALPQAPRLRLCSGLASCSLPVSDPYQMSLLSERGTKWSLSILPVLRLVYRNRSVCTGSRLEELYPLHGPFFVEPSNQCMLRSSPKTPAFHQHPPAALPCPVRPSLGPRGGRGSLPGSCPGRGRGPGPASRGRYSPREPP